MKVRLYRDGPKCPLWVLAYCTWTTAARLPFWDNRVVLITRRSLPIFPDNRKFLVSAREAVTGSERVR